MFGRYLAGAITAAWLLTLVGCGGRSSNEPADDRPAGEVIEVSGTVTAERVTGGQTTSRPLAVGDTVLGAETIVTGADGEVTIRLFHNDARWTLGADKRRTLRESAAWSAPKGGGDVLAGGGSDDTAVAGRHAERSAADTAATAMAPADEAIPAAQAPAEERAPVERERAKKADSDRDRAERVARELKMAEIGVLSAEGGVMADILGKDLEGGGEGGFGVRGIGEGGGGTGESGIGLGTIGTIGKGGGGGGDSGYGQGGGAATTTASAAKVTLGATVAEGIDPSVAKRMIRQRVGALRYCYEHGLKANPALAGRLEVDLVVDAEGQVVGVSVGGDEGLKAAIGDCIAARLRQIRFPLPAERERARITQPLDFAPPAG